MNTESVWDCGVEYYHSIATGLISWMYSSDVNIVRVWQAHVLIFYYCQSTNNWWSNRKRQGDMNIHLINRGSYTSKSLRKGSVLWVYTLNNYGLPQVTNTKVEYNDCCYVGWGIFQIPSTVKWWHIIIQNEIILCI